MRLVQDGFQNPHHHYSHFPYDFGARMDVFHHQIKDSHVHYM